MTAMLCYYVATLPVHQIARGYFQSKTWNDFTHPPTQPPPTPTHTQRHKHTQTYFLFKWVTGVKVCHWIGFSDFRWSWTQETQQQLDVAGLSMISGLNKWNICLFLYCSYISNKNILTWCFRVLVLIQHTCECVWLKLFPVLLTGASVIHQVWIWIKPNHLHVVFLILGYLRWAFLRMWIVYTVCVQMVYDRPRFDLSVTEQVPLFQDALWCLRT